VTLALVLGFGWYEEGFMRLLYFTTPVFWFFATLVSISLFILRWREPETRRPHRVVFYPLTPLLFLLSSVFLLYESFVFALTESSAEAMWTIVILGVGVVVSLIDRPKDGPAVQRVPQE
jgi:amino acid transporter